MVLLAWSGHCRAWYPGYGYRAPILAGEPGTTGGGDDVEVMSSLFHGTFKGAMKAITMIFQTHCAYAPQATMPPAAAAPAQHFVDIG